MPPSGGVPRGVGGGDDEEDVLRQRRKQQLESVNAAVERARQRREDEERRMREEQLMGSREKLRQLDEKNYRQDSLVSSVTFPSQTFHRIAANPHSCHLLYPL